MKPLSVLVWLILISANALVTNTEEYVRLISDVYEIFKSSSIIFYYSSDTGTQERNEIFNIAIRFSRKRIMTSLLTFEKSEKFTIYNKREKEMSGIPMLVIFLTTETSLQKYIHQLELKNLLLRYKIHSFWKLFIFMKINGENEKPLLDFCTNPVGNPFGLRFDSQILIKCYDDTNIREWYSVMENETDIHDFAIWNNKLILKTNLTIYERRGGLRGKILRIAKTETRFVGYRGKILELLKETLNFSLKFVPDKGTIGSFNKNTKSSSGVMNLIIRAKVDLSIYDIELTAERLRYADVTSSLMLSENYLFIKKPENTASWIKYYIKPFYKSIWKVLILFVLITPKFLTLMEIKIRPFYVHSSISENYLNVWGIFCQQSLAEFPTATTLRIAYFSIISLSAIIWSAYCASLTSIVYVPNSDLQFKSVEDFLSDGSYNLIVIKDSPNYEFFQTSADNRPKSMNRLMLRKDKLPENVKTGFKMVCEQKVAFYVKYSLKQLIDNDIQCETYKISSGKFDHMRIILPKNSQYKEVINYYILKFKNFGLLNRIQRSSYKVFLTTSKLPKQKHQPVKLPIIALPLVIVISGILVGIIILCFEKIYFTQKNC